LKFFENYKTQKMIDELVKRFMDGKSELRNQFGANEPGSYGDIVEAVVKLVTDSNGYGEYNLDPDKIRTINDGDCQGVLLFIIRGKGYQPRDYWYVKVVYGSCSACDTFQAIRDAGDWESNVPTEGQLNDYLTLALHIVQGLKKME